MKLRLHLILLSVFLISVGCSMKNQPADFDIQGHRGARGIMPENTIPAMIYALESGVTTLELDVVITKDHNVILSHEPYMSAKICLDSTGASIPAEQDTLHNIYTMTYEEIRRYDCGTLTPDDFPEQRSLSVTKPLLSSVIDTVEAYVDAKDIPDVDYNIEIKSTPRGDNRYHPEPDQFSNLIIRVLQSYPTLYSEKRFIIQSFDFRVLRYLNTIENRPDLSMLVWQDRSVEDELHDLGFIPEIYSPNYRNLNQSKITTAQASGMKVIPWTINDPGEAKRMVYKGVDGIITDYPDEIRQALN